MKRLTVVAVLLLSACATMDKPTQDGVGVGLGVAMLLGTTVPIATPLWVVPVGGYMTGKLTHDLERDAERR